MNAIIDKSYVLCIKRLLVKAERYEHTMQQPGRQQPTSNVQVVSITSSIPISHTIPQLALGADMLNSPTFRLSHYLYRSALIAAIFHKQCIAFLYFCTIFL